MPAAFWKRSDQKTCRDRRNASSGSEMSGGGFNRAFDEYRATALNKLADDEREFQDFLERLRLAKDRVEFDQFMSDRKNRPAAAEAG